jgi:hypothetical protein
MGRETITTLTLLLAAAPGALLGRSKSPKGQPQEGGSSPSGAGRVWWQAPGAPSVPREL